MIDIHSHLLPAVDDGSPSVQVSVAVLAKFGSQGIEQLVCTPHLKASRVATVPHDAYEQRLVELIAAAPPKPKLSRGWEIMLDVPGVDLTSPALALARSSAVLVEFPHTGVPNGATLELVRLRMSGVVPVLAHPERYYGCTLALIREWREIGIVIQVDAVALLAGGPMGELAQAILEQGLADCLASDNHGDSRSLAGTRTWLEELGAFEQADLLTRINPGRVLANAAVLPVAPIPMHRGLMRRLRDLLHGKKRMLN